MKTTRLSITILLLIAAFFSSAKDIHMTVDDVFTLSDTDKWNVTVEKELSLRFADVIVTPKGRATFSLKIWFKCDTKDLSQYDTPENIWRTVKKMLEPYAAGIVEKSPEPVEIRNKGWIGYMVRATDASLVGRKQAVDGEFLYMYKGIIRLSEDSALGFSLMTNDPDSAETKELFNYIRAFAKPKVAQQREAPLLREAESNDVLGQIEHMIVLGNKAESSLGESIADGIQREPAKISKVLVEKLNGENLTEQQLAVYVWAFGLTKDHTGVSAIETLYKQSKSDLVRWNCLRALSMIGGKQAEEFLLANLDAMADKEMQFNILNLLGQMQCEAALPKAEDLLKQEKELYWQPIFFFGKMGDKAVPFLLKKISDKDSHVRANALNVLGQWLISPEAAKPLQERYWREPDAELRYVILCSLERTMADLTQMKAFFEQAATKEKDGEVGKFARETIDSMDKMRAALTVFSEKKQPWAPTFQREYAQLFKTAGKKGSFEVLGTSSTAADEPKLKVLRERILQRDSDEAFNDYQKVNQIILKNRMIKATGVTKTVQPSIPPNPRSPSAPVVGGR